MSYSLFETKTGQYAIDTYCIMRLIRSYWTTHYVLHFATESVQDEVTWSTFSFGLPGLASIDVPWKKVREAAATATIRDLLRYSERYRAHMPDIARELDGNLKAAGRNRIAFVTKVKAADRFNRRSIERSLKGYTNADSAMKFVRDAAADVVMIGAQMATGGAAELLLGGAAVLKGIGKYQDTADPERGLKAAVVYGAGSLVLGGFKTRAAKLSNRDEYLLILAQGILEGSTALVAGDDFSKALASGALKIASASTAQALFGNDTANAMFEKLPVPLVLTATKMDTTNVINKLAEKGTKKGTEKISKVGLEVASGAFFSDSPPPDADTPFVLKAGVLEDRWLLRAALVNMSKGIGHGS
jgi:hypothetical protein